MPRFNPQPKPEPREKKQPVPLKRAPIKKRVPKATGELSVFDEIFEERGGICQVTGVKLFPKGHKYYHFQFAHVLSKKAAPKFRLYKKNIVLMSMECHQLQENFEKALKDKPEWAFYWKLFDELKAEYNQLYKIKSKLI